MLLVQRYKYGRIIKPVWMFDSFQGLPPADERDGPLAAAYQRDVDSPYYYDNCSAALGEVRIAIKHFGFSEEECRVVPGWFSDSLPPKTTTLGREGIALLRVDCDWYEPVRFVLDTLLPHTTDDARVILDDYYFWDGCARATHDFLAGSGQAYRIRTIGEFVGAWFEKKGVRTDVSKL
jgi:O-methyltransferase